MIETLELTNFMSVTYAKHTFSPGLNVLRGLNEAGKSTRFLAVAYALWGARALPDTLEDTVTWGQPASSLKVVLGFSVEGISYTITRNRSGATLAGGTTLSSGQAEVTACVERLTGASAGTGMLTLLTNQGGLQSSLDSVALIEKLSNTSLVDELITAVGKTYPSGNTKSLEIELAKEVAKPVEPDASIAAAAATCEASLESAQSRHAAVLAELDSMKPTLESAANLIALRTDTERTMRSLQGRLKPRMPTPVEPDEPRSLEELQVLRADAEGFLHKKQAREVFNSLPCAHSPGAASLYAEELAGVKQANQEFNAKLTALTAKRAVINASGIWEDCCSLCGKRLTDVPAVVQVNLKVTLALAELDREIAETKAETVKLDQQVIELENLLKANEVVTAKLPLLTEYCSIEQGFTPPKVAWTAGPLQTAPTEDFNRLITELHNNRSQYKQTLAEVSAHNRQCDAIEKELSRLVVPDTKDAEAVILAGSQLNRKGREESERVSLAQQALTEARHEADKAQSVFAAQMVSYDIAIKSREQMQQLLREFRENNSLIDKLKALKPVIAKTLWSLVLLSVSTVFSQLRGLQSVVTRNSDGFLINGRKARSYSGSTKDLLGLAIRITLQKTFLPNLTFCLLDEPAAAADAAREEAMLAALARVDFSQVILVTHSDLADTFAQSVHVL